MMQLSGVDLRKTVCVSVVQYYDYVDLIILTILHCDLLLMFFTVPC